MATEKDYYQILGVSKQATDAELKTAYRKAALQWHPDKHQGSDKIQAEEKFKEINQAYEVLRDTQKRQTYDQYGHAAFTQGGGTHAQGNPFAGGFGQQKGPFRYYTSGNINVEDMFGGFSDPFDIFEQFFGGGGSPFSRSRQQQKPLYRINLDFLDAVKGTEKSFIIEGKKRVIKIPAGVDTNTHIRFNDFDVIVTVREHAIFKRQGQDIVVDIPISYSLAALGGTVSVPTIDGDFTLKVRPGTQAGTLVRLRGKGIPYPRRSERGDQYVRYTIQIPTNLSRRQKELLREFDE